jgi:molecular chaperone GrpE
VSESEQPPTAHEIESVCTDELWEEAPAAVPETSPLQSTQVDTAAWLDQLARLEGGLQEALALAKHRDELVDRLHRENQQLRQGELHSAMLPLLRDLMRLLDDLEQILRGEPSVGDVDFVHGALLEILGRNGVESFAPTSGEPFDSAIHAAVGTAPTSDPAADRTICLVRRAGFRREDGSIVRAADVTVNRYRPAAASDAGAEQSAPVEAADAAEPDTNEERT